MANELNKHHKTSPSDALIDSKAVQQQFGIMLGQMYMGPIPSADEFAKYEDVLPGSADRILKMAEQQSEHRQSMENKTLEESIKTSQRGQLFGFILALAVIFVGCWLLITGKDAWGLATIIAEVIGLVGLFVYSRESEKRELYQKGKKK